LRHANSNFIYKAIKTKVNDAHNCTPLNLGAVMNVETMQDRWVRGAERNWGKYAVTDHARNRP
jgi:hypothetical protein